MDEDNYLVLIKGKDETRDVHSYEIRDSMVRMTYRSTRTYTYARGNVVVLSNPVVTHISAANVVYGNEVPPCNVTRILEFDSKVRVRFDTGER